MKLIAHLLTVACMALIAPFVDAGIIDFDGETPGEIVSTLAGVDFSSNLPGALELIVSTGFDTTSSPNYLGVNDGGDEVFFGGDELYLLFSDPITALSVSFIAVPGVDGRDFSIVTAEGTATGSELPDFVLPDFGEVFNVSLSLAAPVTSATFASVFTVSTFNIDDIAFGSAAMAVPEPSTLALVLLPISIWRFGATRPRFGPRFKKPRTDPRPCM